MADSGNTVVNRGNTPGNAGGAGRSAAEAQAMGGRAKDGDRLREVAAHLRRIGTLAADAQAEVAEAEARLSDQAPDNSNAEYWRRVKAARLDRPAGIPYHGSGS